MDGKVLTRFHDNLILVTMQEIAKDKGFKLQTNPRVLTRYNEWNEINCQLKSEEMVADFNVQQMPGCCAVLTLSYITPYRYTQENVDMVIQFVEEAAHRAGFGSVSMTQVVPAYSKMFWRDQPWIKCLKRDWKPSDPFRNAKSGHLVVYLTKDLGQKGKVEGFERTGVE